MKSKYQIYRNPMDDSKKIGFWTCTALVVGNTIGMGIFLLPASLAPFGFNALIGWVVESALERL